MTHARQLRRRLWRKAWQRARRARLVAAGLTTDGKPRQQRRHDDLSHLHGPARKRAIAVKIRNENSALGLTRCGKRVRMRRAWPQLRGLKGRAYANAWKRLRTRERRLAGFTGRGTPLKRFSSRVPARKLREISYDFFRKSMGDCKAPDFLSVLERDAA